MIRVLVVDDSAISRDLLSSIFNSDDEIEVVGSAANGEEAVKLAAELAPDVVTMDIHMPTMNGFEATKEIMIQSPTRIIIVSASTAVTELRWAMQALEVGALTLKQKPPGVASPDFDRVASDLIETVKTLSDLRVVRHHRRQPTAESSPAAPPIDDSAARFKVPVDPIEPEPIRVDLPSTSQTKFRAVAVTTSTGGPPALHQMLGQLPENFPLPILLVQHIAEGFVGGFASWLDSVIPMKVKLAEAGELLLPSTIYVGPHGKHLGVSRTMHVTFHEGDPSDSFVPSGDRLFQSCADSLGDKVIGVVLTGMGRDGTQGMSAMHQVGCTTIAQDEETSIVFGMPRSAIAAKVVDFVMSIDVIAPRLVQLLQ